MRRLCLKWGHIHVPFSALRYLKRVRTSQVAVYCDKGSLRLTWNGNWKNETWILVDISSGDVWSKRQYSPIVLFINFNARVYRKKMDTVFLQSTVGLWKGHLFFNKSHTKGVPFPLSKWYKERVWDWALGRGIPVQNFVE